MAEVVRILTVVDDLGSFGGVARSSLDLYGQLSTIGHQVGVLYGKQGPMCGRWAVVASAMGDLGGSPLLPRSRPVVAVRRFRTSVAVARKFSPDLISIQAPRQYELGFVLAKVLRVPLLVQLRTDPDDLSWRFRAILRRAESLVAVSEHIKVAWGDALSVESHRVRVIHTGVDRAAIARAVAARSVTRTRIGVDGSTRLVSVIGRIDPEKGVAEAMEAFIETEQDFGDLEMVVVGAASDSAQGTEYRRRVRRLAEHPSIRLLGHVDDPLPLLAASDLVLHPTQRDAFPRTVLEALASRVPVLASSVGGVPEILGAGLTEYLIDSSTPGIEAGLRRWAIGDLDHLDDEVARRGAEFDLVTSSAAYESEMRRLVERR